VVQCYARKVGDTNPPRLAAWSKHFVAAGSHRDFVVDIPWTAFRRWNPAKRAWRISGGKWEILIAASSLDVRAAVIVEIDECESGPSRGSDQPPVRPA
ncbi:MAG: fibronectin type III-like domain-contianing protein, partial [Actinomycetota bacterium]